MWRKDRANLWASSSRQPMRRYQCTFRKVASEHTTQENDRKRNWSAPMAVSFSFSRNWQTTPADSEIPKERKRPAAVSGRLKSGRHCLDNIESALLVKWYHSCLPSNWPGFDSRTTQNLLLFHTERKACWILIPAIGKFFTFSIFFCLHFKMDAKKVAPKVNGQLRPYYLIQRARKVNIQHLLLVQKQKLPINVSDFLLLSAVY